MGPEARSPRRRPGSERSARTPGRPWIVRRLVVVAAIAALLAPVGGWGGAARTPGSGAIAPTSVNGASLSFGERAGYSAAEVALTSGITPTTGPMSVVVTFPDRQGTNGTAGTSLSTAEFADRYGATVSDLDAARAYFAAEGLEVSAPTPDHLSLDLSGPASAVDRAFRTTVASGSYEGRPVVLPITPPSLPLSLEANVAGVAGLASGFAPFSFDLTPTLGGSPVTPAQARNAYNLTALYNLSSPGAYPTGESIAVILWGDGYAPSDLATFEATDYSSVFPVPTIDAYPIGGAPAPNDNATSSPDPMAVEELTLDIEWSMSMAPGATIDAIYAPDGPASSGYSPNTAYLTEALEEALTLNVSVISMSFGTPEASDSPLWAAWEPLFSEARERGITVVAATGDTGGDLGMGCSGGPSVDYPALSPNVTAVGGTALSFTGLMGTTPVESAWNGSGGGYSTDVPAPAWQEVGSARGPIEANGHRGLPDVSATAADNSLYFDGGTRQAAGTSFATPLWAGLIASMDQVYGARLGWINDRLYHVGASEPTGEIGDGLVDVTSGSTCLGSATVGWDPETGWGSPRAVLLYEDLVGSFVDLSITAVPTTVAPGGIVLVRAELENRTGAPLGDTPVNVTLRSSSSIGPCAGLFDSGTPTTNGTGGIALELHVPYCYLGAHAIVNVSVITPKLYGALARRIGVNLLGLVPALEFLESPPWNAVGFAGIVGPAIGLGWWLGARPPKLVGRRRTPPPAAGPSPPLRPPPPRTLPGASSASPTVPSPPARGAGPPPPPSPGVPPSPTPPRQTP